MIFARSATLNAIHGTSFLNLSYSLGKFVCLTVGYGEMHSNWEIQPNQKSLPVTTKSKNLKNKIKKISHLSSLWSSVKFKFNNPLSSLIRVGYSGKEIEEIFTHGKTRWSSSLHHSVFRPRKQTKQGHSRRLDDRFSLYLPRCSLLSTWRSGKLFLFCFPQIYLLFQVFLISLRNWNMAFNIKVKIHPVVLFQIADAYERRNMENHRVIGTLLGKKGLILDMF